MDKFFPTEMKKITYSTPGKIHFLGEHTVVHGKPAILAATNLRIYVAISSSSQHRQHRVLNSFKPKDYSSSEKDASREAPYDSSEEVKRLRETVERVIIKRFKLKKLPAYVASINSKIPIGSGLGSSAASSAAYCAALLDFLKIEPTLELVNELAYECDKVFNGNPSGGDNTTVIYGGFIWYRKELDFLKTFRPLPFKLHKNIKQFYLIDSGKPAETTGELVGKVRIKLHESRIKVQMVFDHQEQLVKELATALKEGDELSLLKIIKEGEGNLEKLGVVGKKTKDIIRKVEKIGGAVKIMGGGGIKDGAGMLLAYHKEPNRLVAFAKKQGWSIISIKLGGEGLRKENA